MDQQKRLMLALGLMFLVLMVHSLIFGPKPGDGVADAGTVAVASPSDAGVAVGPTTTPEVPTPSVAAEEEPQPDKRTVDVQRAVVHYSFTNQGAGLLKAELQGQKMREQKKVTLAEGLKRLVGGNVEPAPQMDMARPAPESPLSLEVGIQGAQPFASDTRFSVKEEQGRLSFVARRNGWEVRKTFRIEREGMELEYQLQVRNLSQTARTGELWMSYARGVEPGTEEAPNMLGGVGNQSKAVCATGDTVHSALPGGDEPAEAIGPIRFFGVDQQYFLGAVYPLDGAKEGRCNLVAAENGRVARATFPLSLGPGEAYSQRFGVYVGPKDLEMLAAVPAAELSGGAAAGTSPRLEETVDFGMFAVISKLLLFIMKKFFALIHNWGVAIILLTLLVKVVLVPLTHKSMVAAEQMKKLQPKIEEIRKKYGEDRERQNLEMMKVYQEAKVNPLGGCLPMLVQLPVWFALFTTLRNSFEIYGEPFIAPVWMDLTYKDPTYILPLLLGVTMVATQKLQPQMMDPTQAKMMTYVMPILFTGLMLNYPAGLSLYIFTNNILSIAQQYALKRYLARTGKLAPAQPPTTLAARKR